MSRRCLELPLVDLSSTVRQHNSLLTNTIHTPYAALLYITATFQQNNILSHHALKEENAVSFCSGVILLFIQCCVTITTTTFATSTVGFNLLQVRPGPA